MNKDYYRHYKPAHSNLIIHWTGFDIDKEYDKCWCSSHNSITNDNVTIKYLERLKSVLKYGLWMTKNVEDEYINKIERPWVARTCFTELKLSEVRNHATKYGRLGVGFKRPFLWERLGSPMMYYNQERKEPNWYILSHKNNNKFNDEDYYSCFLKPMKKENSKEFEYFDESEWRIIYSDGIDKCLKDDENNIAGKFKKFSGIKNQEFLDYVSKCKKKPEYLIPIGNNEKWFTMIIYPSLNVKVAAEKDGEIRKLIKEIKPDAKQNYIEELSTCEKFSKPIEIDLDACRNF